MRRINWKMHLRVINNDLDRLLTYIAILEDALKREHEALEAMIEEKEKELTPEELTLWRQEMDTGVAPVMALTFSPEERTLWRQEMHGSSLAETTEAIPQIMWHGAFVSLMSYTEHTMLGQARRHLSKVKHFAPELLPAGLKEDFRYIEGAVRYWKDWGFAFPNNDRLWNELSMYRKIRNWIAHHGGELDESNEATEIAGYVRRGAGTSLAIGPVGFFSDKTLILSAEFCREAVETLQKFFAGYVPRLP
jgi:hypothetical protein